MKETGNTTCGMGWGSFVASMVSSTKGSGCMIYQKDREKKLTSMEISLKLPISKESKMEVGFIKKLDQSNRRKLCSTMV